MTKQSLTSGGPEPDPHSPAVPDTTETTPMLVHSGRAYIFPLAIATTGCIWFIAYVCHFPGVHSPAPLTAVLLMATLMAGGFVAGRYALAVTVGGHAAATSAPTLRRILAGVWVGLVSSMMNLMIIGSLLTHDDPLAAPNTVVPSALIWLPGSLLAGAVFGGIGAAIGSRCPSPRHESTNWFAVGAWATVAVTLLLIVAGGIVTGTEEGMAVPDWPNSFGYNMFLYPLGRMTGGMFYEHAHRLLGSLVGLSTLLLMVYVFMYDRRRYVRWWSVVAFVFVVIQGILGGLRVTRRFTMEQLPAGDPGSVPLAAVHGVFGQVFFATLVALAVMVSAFWLRPRLPGDTPLTLVAHRARSDRNINIVLILLLIVQLVFGSLQRHFDSGLLVHITLAVVVLAVAAASGVRAWGLYKDHALMRRTGMIMTCGIGMQLFMGLLALIAVSLRQENAPPSVFEVTITTIHQAVGAVLLAVAVVLMLTAARLAFVADRARSDDRNQP